MKQKLTISLWDFSWYTRTGPGEPFEDLDKAFTEAGARGYNTVRICAMPFLIFRSGLGSDELTLEPLGGDYGQRTRWYDLPSRTTIHPREHLLELFRAAARHRFRVIVSSWEYQQSASFASTREWFDALMAIDPERRAEVLADAQADLIDLLIEHELADVVAFVEVHNEVQVGRLTDGLSGDPVLALNERLTRAIDRFHRRHPDVLCAVDYAYVPVGSLRGVPDNADVVVFHPYVYGVLGQLIEDFALRTDERFPQERADALLRRGAVPYDDWSPGPDNAWKLDATICGTREIYVHDWCDVEAWDRWLYDRWGEWRHAMTERLAEWIAAAGDFAQARGIPLVFGEGWVGYTPLYGRFEEDVIGAELCRLAMRSAREVGAWGTVVCSNAAPHHPMWDDIDLQRECTSMFTDARPAIS